MKLWNLKPRNFETKKPRNLESKKAKTKKPNNREIKQPRSCFFSNTISELFCWRASLNNASAEFQKAKLIISLAESDNASAEWKLGTVVVRDNLTRVANLIHAPAKYQDAKFKISRADEFQHRRCEI